MIRLTETNGQPLYVEPGFIKVIKRIPEKTWLLSTDEPPHKYPAYTEILTYDGKHRIKEHPEEVFGMIEEAK